MGFGDRDMSFESEILVCVCVFGERGYGGCEHRFVRRGISSMEENFERAG